MDRSFDLVALLKQQPTKTHKVRPSQFVSVAGGVQKRLETNIKNRKSSRLSIFDRIRNIPKESPRPPPLSEVQLKAEHRKQQLEKWKEEKDKKKKAAAAQKKKPFVAGVSHRTTFGPPPPPRPMPSTSGRVTRSQASKQRSAQAIESQSFAPTNAAFKPPQFKNTKVPTLAPVTKKKTNKTKNTFTFEPVLPKPTQNSRTTRSKAVLNKPNLQTRKPDSKVASKPNEKVKGKLKNQSPKLRKTATSSLESAKSSDSGMTSSSSVSLEMGTPKNSKNVIPRSESSSEEKLRSPRLPPGHVSLTPEQIIEEAKNISPCVTMSRGKDNARREMKKKLDEGLLDEDNSNMDSVNHFRRQLDSEVSRITGLCEAWDKIFAQTVLPEPIQELVLAALGQARLLVSQKMQQFAALVGRCARPAPGSALVTPADLAGFWDMLFMQVENVDMRFKKLEELRAREWEDEAPPPAARARPAHAARRPRPGPPPGPPSRLRDVIAAARKAKKEQESQSSDNSESDKSEPAPESKTFEAGFFSVSSPLKRPASPAAATPANKSSLLKTVLSSEARKASVSKTSTSFAMLRASLKSKNVDIEGVSPLLQTPTMTPVNLFATPARSILKQANPASSRKPERLKTVLFHETSPASYTSCGSEEAETRETKMEEVTVEEVKDEGPEKENKPATRRRSRLSRQDAEEKSSPVMTRSRRRSALTPLPAAAAGAAADAGVEQDTPRAAGRAPPPCEASPLGW